jgi:hypothetical protein
VTAEAEERTAVVFRNTFNFRMPVPSAFSPMKCVVGRGHERQSLVM